VTTEPRVSVIVPVRDGERYLSEALDSILGQTIPPSEVIVVDDGSRDGTPQVLDRYGARVQRIHQPPTGQFAALNRGVAAARNNLIAFLDADDVWTPRSLECRLDRLLAPDEPDAVFGRWVKFVSPEFDDDYAARFRFAPDPTSTPALQTTIFRRSVFDVVGYFDPTLRTSGNVDWLARARLAGIRSVEVPDVVTLRRIHDANVGIVARDTQQADLLRVVRAHRERKRAKRRGDSEGTG
jgi:glycosyltransferase involved in cell wall biosynthesis